MFVDEILEHNRAYVRGRAPRPLGPVERLPLAVVACYDPRLDELVLQSLGLRIGEAFLLRTAGAIVPPNGDPLRSLAMAIFLFGATDVLVLGHTSCRMAELSNAEFIDAFRARQVAREAFGDVDLRDWVGAIPSPRGGVVASVNHITAARFLPHDVAVAGALLDDTTGAIEIVVRPGERIAAPTPEPAPAPAAEVAPAPAEGLAATPGATTAPGGLATAAEEFIDAVQAQSKWRREAEHLRGELAKKQSPAAKYALVEALVRRAAADSKSIATAFERMKREAAAARRKIEPQELVELFRRMTGRRG